MEVSHSDITLEVAEYKIPFDYSDITSASWEHKYPVSSYPLERNPQKEEMSRKEVLETPGLPLVYPPRSFASSNSPNFSRFRAGWETLSEWSSLPNEVFEYWNALPYEELAAVVDPDDVTNLVPESVRRLQRRNPINTERQLYRYFDTIYAQPHNQAAEPIVATQPHAWLEETRSNGVVGEPDFIFLFQGVQVGVIEIETFWNVTAQQIDEVLFGWARLSGPHAGRLAVEQTYGYLVRNARQIGVLSTLNGFVFMKRENLGRLHMTRLIPCNIANPDSPTILQILYYLSGQAATLPLLPETYADGTLVRVSWADGSSARRAPSASNPPSPPATRGRDARRRDPQIIYSLQADVEHRAMIFEPWKLENQLGHKTFLLQVDSNETVVGKLWDGYKHSAVDRDHEVEAYMHLQSLWGREVPRFIGCGTLDFCWALLLERIQAKELSATLLNPTVAENVLTAFRDIHALGVIHSDIRTQNILVKEDHSVVIIDFEFSSFKDVTMDQIASENEEIEDLLDNLRGVGCPCKGCPEG